MAESVAAFEGDSTMTKILSFFAVVLATVFFAVVLVVPVDFFVFLVVVFFSDTDFFGVGMTRQPAFQIL